jgi:6-phosphogluconolactonase/glucosamine-6-phosphate isomerase/deaminase
MLLNVDFLALHITGTSKQDVFEQAAAGGDIVELPIRSAIFQDRVALNVYHAN